MERAIPMCFGYIGGYFLGRGVAEGEPSTVFCGVAFVILAFIFVKIVGRLA